MADNYSPTTDGGLDFASDDIASVQWPYAKIAFGADGSVTRVSSTDPLPIAPGTGATSLGKAVDAAAGAADTGVAILGVRDDVLGTLTPADGDYAQWRMTSRGALWVSLDAALPAGTNNVGKVDIDSLPASARTSDTISAAQATDAIMNERTALTPKFATIVGAIGDNTVVAAVTGKIIRVTSYFIVATAATTVRFESGAGGTALTGAMSLAANGILQASHDPTGHFQTASGALLNLELTGAAQGYLKYIEV